MEEMCRVRYGEGGGASMTSPRKHFSKSPGVHQPRSFHPPLPLASSSNLLFSLGQALRHSPPTSSLLPCRDLHFLTSTCLSSAGFSSAQTCAREPFIHTENIISLPHPPLNYWPRCILHSQRSFQGNMCSRRFS